MTPTDPIEERASKLDWPRTEAAQRLVEHLAGRHQMSDETHILILEMESEMTRLRRIEAAARALVRVSTLSALGRSDEVAALHAALETK